MTTEYHKIQSVYKRDPATKFKTFIEGDWSVPEFEYLAHNEWLFTEKVDGTNIRIIINPLSIASALDSDDDRSLVWHGDNEIVIKGKTDRAEIPKSLGTALLEKIAPKLNGAFPKITDTYDSICLYGEGYGPKIQGGGKYRADHSFVLFDIKVGPWWLTRESVEQIGAACGIDVVPLRGTGTLFEAIEMVRQGFTSRWGDFVAEGLVMRPKVELTGRDGKRIIAKVKHKDFAPVSQQVSTL